MPRGSRRSRPSSRFPTVRGSASSFVLIAVVLAIMVWGGLARLVTWNPYFVWLAAWGLVTFLFYGWDKLQSMRGGWRVPEIALHVLSLIGGVGGGWLGMLVFRHKTQKAEFKLALVVASVIHGALTLSLLR